MADPLYTCCEDGMLSQVPPTDRSGLCPQCHPGCNLRRLTDEELAGHLRSLGSITWRDCWNLAEHLRREGVIALGVDTSRTFARVADAITDSPEEADALQRQYDERRAASGVPGTDATEQALSLYAAQAEAIREVLDAHAPNTSGNLQARLAQVFAAFDAGLHPHDAGVGASDEAQAHDARRYRFLRDAAHPDTNGGLRCVGNCADGGPVLHISGRDLDRAVDAAGSASADNRVDPTACPECIGMGCEACNGTGDAPTMKAKCDGNHGGPRCADPECWNDDSVGAMSGPASLTELRRLIADDAYAMTFQTFGQYRSALLKAAYTITAHGVAASDGVRVLNALDVLKRMDYQAGDRVLVENFLRILGERGMWVIDNPLAAGVPEAFVPGFCGMPGCSDCEKHKAAHGVALPLKGQE